MVNTGRSIRLRRIIDDKTNSSVIFPFDHGAFSGPIPGTHDVRGIIKQVAAGGADAVIVLKGIAKLVAREIRRDMGLIVQISCVTTMSPYKNYMAPSGTVEEAVSLGADGISVFFPLGHAQEQQMLTMVSKITDDCERFGMPFIAMAEYPNPEPGRTYDIEYLKHACRLAAEYGADLIKTTYTNNKHSFREVVDSCPAPIVIAGGPKITDNRMLFQAVNDAMEAGAIGVSIGRNIFQHNDPQAMTRALVRLVHDRVGVEKAIKELNR